MKDPWLESFNYYQLLDRFLALPNDELEIEKDDNSYTFVIKSKLVPKLMWCYQFDNDIKVVIELIPNDVINITVYNVDRITKYDGKILDRVKLTINPELQSHIDYCNKIIQKYLEMNTERELVSFDRLTSNLKDYMIRFLLQLKCHTKWEKYDTPELVGYYAKFGNNTVIVRKESLCYPVIHLHCSIENKLYNIEIHQKNLIDHYESSECRVKVSEGDISVLLSTIYNRAKSCCPIDFTDGLIRIIDECFYNIEND